MSPMEHSSTAQSDGGNLLRGLATVFSAMEQAKAFGEDTSRDGARMFGHIPHVAPRAWFHIMYPPLGANDIAEIERSIQRPVPSAYQNLLRITNGLTLFGGSLSLFGRRTDYSRDPAVRQPFDLSVSNLKERPPGAKDSWFFFAFYKQDGSLAYLDDEKSPVYRGNRTMSDPKLNEWPDLAAFLSAETARLATHFDERGRPVNAGRPTTPS